VRRVGALFVVLLASLLVTLVSLTLDRAPRGVYGDGLEASFGFPFAFATSKLSVPTEGFNATFNPWENPTTFDGAWFLASWAVFAVCVVIAWRGLTAFWRRIGSAAA
jgi:hypothetical protein